MTAHSGAVLRGSELVCVCGSHCGVDADMRTLCTPGTGQGLVIHPGLISPSLAPQEVCPANFAGRGSVVVHKNIHPRIFLLSILRRSRPQPTGSRATAICMGSAGPGLSSYPHACTLGAFAKKALPGKGISISSANLYCPLEQDGGVRRIVIFLLVDKGSGRLPLLSSSPRPWQKVT